jgi:hypothetical protein
MARLSTHQATWLVIVALALAVRLAAGVLAAAVRGPNASAKLPTTVS